MKVSVLFLAVSICLVVGAIFFALDGREQLAHVRAERASIDNAQHELRVEHQAMLATEHRLADLDARIGSAVDCKRVVADLLTKNCPSGAWACSSEATTTLKKP